mmetsp:Transcript_4303/g.6420  ORF Transcript_4303/g.6420 Transcript_4303/m.6420 type:complete len:87 (+) Transcript_4303:133-393(+)
MKWLDVSSNSLSGSVDLTGLPEKIERIFLSNNDFKGECDFDFLPKSLEHIEMYSTKLSGELYRPFGSGLFVGADGSKVELKVKCTE